MATRCAPTLDQVLKLLPGKQRLNLHAFYAETGSQVVDRDELEPQHFARWLGWAKSRRVGLDFNPTYFAHEQANSGYTLSSADPAVRQFWINHGKACRHIAESFAKTLGTPTVHNHWVPDGAKDAPSDRFAPRERLVAAYDAIFADKSVNPKLCVDAVEGKLFGLGSEEYVVGSQEFYSNYALTRDKVLCLDLGHFHPTESVADKVSAHLQYHKKLLLHTSRPLRWDSDHVVILDDAVRNLFLEIARGNAWDRVYVALDFFDASINRLAAYLVGARATRQAILAGFLDPFAPLVKAEVSLSGHQRSPSWSSAASSPGEPCGTSSASATECRPAPTGSPMCPVTKRPSSPSAEVFDHGLHGLPRREPSPSIRHPEPCEGPKRIARLQFTNPFGHKEHKTGLSCRRKSPARL